MFCSSGKNSETNLVANDRRQDTKGSEIVLVQPKLADLEAQLAYTDAQARISERLSKIPLDRYNRLINDMLAIYNTATTCDYHDPLKCDLRLEPDYTDYLLFPYESPTFMAEINEAWEDIKPLYLELHAYVRRKLRDLYGPEKLGRQAPLPAHILGNMWGQSWINILDITIPYPGKFFPDVSPHMVQQGYTPATMFRIAEDFFLSLNLSGMPPDVRENSLLVEPPGILVICQPSAWDFCNKRDYRIKMCAKVTQSDLVTLHHEMTHIEYFMEYRNLHKAFRDGANPGFHEGISEAIALFVGSPKHLQTLGLLFGSEDDVPHNINFLYSMALQKLPFLAFSLALESWRWDVFRGDINKDNYNCRWWDYREKIGGVKPPVLRSEKNFDPGSKYHVPANIPYIK
ncbi:unnamed protein product [Nezara viridula]|uniref:Angiotensin-converting enzyme n=1 Tax=Nezara viridula TaxID=85310 RepID=A0A9P0HD23_NEZVI|nr:unnamed protein product [Nezara viridula]